ncbi:hypothetical protein [Streptomyces flavidovirens]|uniref:hypothetical protein n=1 Tax=Streptomyces flavidovirens TaxID=67298 RepID=UPI0004239342|nr:hypothetical protein [Streptomyces flavidovirens]
MKWTITVEASGAGAEEEPATITAVMMSVPGGAPRIVELIVRASEEGGVSPRAALDIDFEMLAQAMSGVAGPSSRSKDEPESHKRAAVSAPPVAEKAERPYRKMPDADEVKAVFLKLRSVGKVAQHYDVPRYTAQAWVDRLRRLGHLEEPKSSPRRRRG